MPFYIHRFRKGSPVGGHLEGPKDGETGAEARLAGRLALESGGSTVGQMNGDVG
jgi:hypothetical protein